MTPLKVGMVIVCTVGVVQNLYKRNIVAALWAFAAGVGVFNWG